MVAETEPGTRALIARRRATLGPHTPMFYREPLHLTSAEGVWMFGADGTRYLDAYNNVPHVGHCNPVVVEAMTRQASQLNIHTRYLTAPVVEYAEMLLATFAPHLDKVFFTNSGSEANELALRIARQHVGTDGVLVSDFSYHGTTTSLAELSTGIDVAEPLGAHVRTLRIPDMLHAASSEAEVLRDSLAEAASAIASLSEAGHDVSALLFDPLFSTEGLASVPRGYVEGLVDLVHAAGGLVIADEVQSGFGRSGVKMWGHQLFDIRPDLVVLGKPMGNGHPVGATITTSALLDEFGSRNTYFNTFAGNPVSSAVGMAVLTQMRERNLQANAERLGDEARGLLMQAVSGHATVKAVKGTGLFFGLELIDPWGRPDGQATQWLVEDMRERGVLISRIGPDGNVLKIRPPMVFGGDHLELLVERLSDSLTALPETSVGAETPDSQDARGENGPDSGVTS